MAEVAHYGSIIEAGTKSPLKDYTIRFEPEDRAQASPLMTVSDEHGAFDIPKIEDGQKWTMVAVDLKGEATDAFPVNLELGTSSAKRAVYIGNRLSQKVDQRWGTAVLIFLIAFVIAAIVVWINSGSSSVLDKSRAMLDASARLEGLVKRDTTLITAAAVGSRVDAYKNSLPNIEAPLELANEIADAKVELAALGLLVETPEIQISEAVEGLKALGDRRLPKDWKKKVDAVTNAGDDREKLNDAIQELKRIGKGVPSVQSYVTILESAAGEGKEGTLPSQHLKDRKELFQKRLKAVQALTGKVAIVEVEKSAGAFASFDWVVASSVTITVLFWGFVGSAVRLIMVIQGYLRFGRFFVRGVFQHLGLFFAVPILAAGFVKLASGLSIGTLESGFQLNFADPQVMAVAAFFLALSPWGLWERLLSLSGSIMGSPQDQR